jgi:hypothetical protein
MPKKTNQLQKSQQSQQEEENDSDIVSDLDEDEEKIAKDAESACVTDEFKEHVIGYIKIDDMIRQRKEEIKELQDKKKPCEEYILRYLEKVDEHIVELKGGKIRRNQSETKAPLKLDIIKTAIFEGIKTEQGDEQVDDEKCKKMVEDIVTLMEQKRPTTIRVNLKRTFERKKEKKTK